MAHVVVAGGHGQIALLLYPELLARGHTAAGLIRNPDHAADLQVALATPVVCDMEAEDVLTDYLDNADAVVFAAGAGPGSGDERKQTVDLGAALKLMRACEDAGVRRYLMISAMGAADPASGSEPMLPYLKAKAGADQALRESGLDYTIVRPGKLTGDAPTGRVQIAERLDYGDVTRADVAAVLAACLEEPSTFGLTFDLVGGEASVDDELQRLRASTKPS